MPQIQAAIKHLYDWDTYGQNMYVAYQTGSGWNVVKCTSEGGDPAFCQPLAAARQASSLNRLAGSL
jgi:hypothetical protein